MKSVHAAPAGRGPIGDLVVVGAGVAGLSAAVAAARLGFSVTCVEARRAGHNHSSSAGWAKIFRYAYRQLRFAQLLVDAERRWHELEERSQQQLIRPCPGLNIGKVGSPYVAAILDSLETMGRGYELLEPGSPRLAGLGLRLHADEEAVLELDAGAIIPAVALSTLSRELHELGGRLVEGVTVRAVVARSSGLRLETDGVPLHADRVILAVGPWVHDLLPDPPVPLTVTAQQQVIFASDRPIGDGRRFSWAEVVDDDGYGLMNISDRRHVIGSHAPGPAAGGVPAHPESEVGPALRKQIAAFQARLDSDTELTQLGLRTCAYTLAVGSDFVVSRSADLPGVILLSACSGHGFKFALTNGHLAAELALT